MSKRQMASAGSGVDTGSEAATKPRKPKTDKDRFVDAVVRDVWENGKDPAKTTREALNARLREERTFASNARAWQLWLRDVIVRHPLFDAFVLICIICNSVTLAMSNPLMDPNSELAKALNVADTVFTVIFTVEMVVKMLALGIVDGRVCGTRCCGSEKPLFGSIVMDRSTKPKAKVGGAPVASAGEPPSHLAVGHVRAPASRPGPAASVTSVKPLADADTAPGIGEASPVQQGSTTAAGHADTPVVVDDDVTGVTDDGEPAGGGVEGSAGLRRAGSSAAGSDRGTADESTAGGHVPESEHLSAIEDRVRGVLNEASPKFPRAYLGSPWNCLDFIIVVAALLGYIPAVGDSGGSGIRLMRVLRPLRSVNRLPSLRVIISTMLDSFKGMLSVLVLVLFLFVIYGIIGVLFFNGALHQRCFTTVPPASAGFVLDEDTYTLDGFCSTTPDFAYQCPPSETCAARALDPQYGWVSFDNIFLAFLAIYNVISMSNWAPLSYQIADATGSISVIFFVSLILFGTFFSINIVLAVVVASYEDNFEQQQARDRLASALDLLATRESRHARVIAVLRLARSRSLVQIQSEDVGQGDVDAQGGAIANSQSSEEDDDDLPPPPGAGAQVAPSGNSAPAPGSRPPPDGPVTMGSLRGGELADAAEAGGKRASAAGASEAAMGSVGAAEPRSARIVSPAGAPHDTPVSTSSASALHSSQGDIISVGAVKAPRVAVSPPATVPEDEPASPHASPCPRAPMSGAQAGLVRDAAHLVFGVKSDLKELHEAAKRELGPKSAGGEESESDAESDLSEEEAQAAQWRAARSARDVTGASRSKHGASAMGLGLGRAAKAPASPAAEPADGKMTAAVPVASAAGGSADASARSLDRKTTLQRLRDTEQQEAQSRKGSKREDRKRSKLRRQWAAGARIVLAAESRLRTERGWLQGKPGAVLLLNQFVRSGFFSLVIVAAILVNTCLLALDHEGISDSLNSGLELANVVLTVIFTAEMVLKVGGLGPRVYVADAFNVFDAVIVITSLVELAVTSGSDSGDGGSIVGLFRTFRLLRVLKLAKSIKTLRILLVTTINSLPDIGWMSLVLVLFLFIFAVLGVQLFAGSLRGLPTDPPYSFDDVFEALFSVFQVLTGDDWTSIMADTAYATSGAAIIYFIVLHAFGSYIVLSLFVAILLQRFSDQQDAAFDEEDYSELALRSLERRLLARDPRGGMPPQPEDGERIAASPEAAHAIVDVVAEVVEEMQTRDLARRRKARDKKDKHNNKDPGPGIILLVDGSSHPAVIPSDPKHSLTRDDGKAVTEVLHGLNGNALGCLPAQNSMREVVFRLVTSTAFEAVVLVAILVNCVFLAVESPLLDPSSTLANALTIGDYVFAVLFTVEACLKIIAFGVWREGQHAYLRSAWNVLDFFIVIVSLLSLALPDVSALRSLRALRPLRVVVRSPQIQVVIRALLYAMPNIFNVFVLTMLLWLIFAILGVNQFKGRFSSCSDEGLGKAACTGPFMDASGANATREWVTPVTNFDAVGPAMLTLFQVATLSDWATVARIAIASTGKDSAPKAGTNPVALFYFFAFIIIGSFFSLNLFIGVVIDNFNRLKKELDGSAFMTKEQRQLANADKLIRTVKIETRPDPPSTAWRRVAFTVVLHPWFDPFIFGAIIANAVTMCMQFYGMDPTYATVLEVLNTTFLGIFGVEAVLKIAGLGLEVYWRSMWNRFDFIVLLASVIGLFFDGGAGASVIRVFRIARVIRIARVGMLRQLLTTLMNSLPSLWNIGGLLFVLFFIFATLGTNLFGALPLEPVDDFGVSRHANFRDFGGSLFALWRVATGDAWEGLLYSAMAGNPSVAVIYFVVFQVGVAFVMINLFIAVILENFEESNQEEKGDSRLETIHGWAAVWNQFDPLALKWVPVALFPRLMAAAPEPFGFNRHFIRPSTIVGFMRQLRVPIQPRPLSTFTGKIGSRVVNAARAVAVLNPHFAGVPEDGAHVFAGDSIATGKSIRAMADGATPKDGVGPRTSGSHFGSAATIDDGHFAEVPALDRQPTVNTRTVWCVNLTTTLKALAAVVINLDVKLENEAGQRRFFAHEWLLVRMIEEVAPAWLQRRRAAVTPASRDEQLRAVGSFAIAGSSKVSMAPAAAAGAASPQNGTFAGGGAARPELDGKVNLNATTPFHGDDAIGHGKVAFL